MGSLLTFLDPLLPFALAATTALYLVEFLRGPTRPIAGGPILLGITVALLCVRFGVFVAEMGRPPVASPAEAFTTIALAITVLYAAFQVLHRSDSAGFLFLAVATVFQGLGAVGEPADMGVNSMLREPWFGVHVVSAIIGYTAFAVSAIYSVLFLLLYADLKKRRFGIVYDRMPSLDVLARMAIRSTTLGFTFLTAAIIVGSVGWSRVLDHPVLQDPKVLSTLIVWLIYGTGVSLYFFAGWRGIRCIGITLAAFALMILSSWLVPIVLGSAHGVQELL